MSYPRYPKYKDSGVEWLGEVPEGWVFTPLWALFRRTKKVGYAEEELLSVYRDYGVVPKSSRDDNNNNPSEDLSPYQLVVNGDLVINKMKAWQGSVAISQYRGIVSPAYFVYTAIHQSDSEYLHYLLRSEPYICAYFSVSKGIRINQWDLDPQYHSSLPVLLPTQEEQQTIAAFLDRETTKIDALIAEQEKLVTLLQEKRQAVISHAVTKGLNPDAPMKDSGVEWLGEVPEGWEIAPLKKIISFIESGTSVNAVDVPATEEEFGVLKTSCVYTGYFRIEENKTVVTEDIVRVSCPSKNNTLIVSRMNTPELVGAAGVVVGARDNIFLPDRLWQVHIIKSNVFFIHYWTQTFGYRGQVKMVCAGTSSSMQNLSQEQFKSFIFSFPPFPEQQAIVEYLDAEIAKIDALITESKKAVELLKERRSALISAAVTGKIDVRNIPLQEAV